MAWDWYKSNKLGVVASFPIPEVVRNNKWASGETRWGVKENSIDLVNLNPALPDDVKKAELAAGKEAEAGMLKGMNFYVKGVEGSIPK